MKRPLFREDNPGYDPEEADYFTDEEGVVHSVDEIYPEDDEDGE